MLMFYPRGYLFFFARIVAGCCVAGCVYQFCFALIGLNRRYVRTNTRFALKTKHLFCFWVFACMFDSLLSFGGFWAFFSCVYRLLLVIFSTLFFCIQCVSFSNSFHNITLPLSQIRDLSQPNIPRPPRFVGTSQLKSHSSAIIS